MSSPTAEPEEPVVPAANASTQPERWRRRLAVAFIVLGGVILASNLGLLAPGVQRAVEVIWPAGIILAGLGLILAGDQYWSSNYWSSNSAQFTVERGEAQEVDLLVSPGMADLRVEAASRTGELLAGELPLPLRPKIVTSAGHTTAAIEPFWPVPSLPGARWSLTLAKDLTWQLDLRSSTGNLDLDLREIALAGLRLRSTFGDVDLTLPTTGRADLDLGLVFGDLAITVPEGMGVKVKLQTGALTQVAHDERRFIRLSPNELGTPLYAVSAQRCTLTVWLGTGDLHLQ